MKKRIALVSCAIAILVIGAIGLATMRSANEGNLERRVKATEKYLQEMIDARLAESSLESTNGRYAFALAGLRRDPEQFLADPKLLHVIMTPKPNHVSIQWLERGFEVQGVYVKDKNGQIAEVIDPIQFQERMREHYWNTFVRTTAIKLSFETEKENSTTSNYPVVPLPGDFELENAEVGLIVGGAHLESHPIGTVH